MKFRTHIMDEFSLQKTDRFQRQQVVHQEGVGVFQSSDDTPEDEADVWVFVTRIASGREDKGRMFAPVSINAGLRSVVFCVTPQQLHHHLCCRVTVKEDAVETYVDPPSESKDSAA